MNLLNRTGCLLVFLAVDASLVADEIEGRATLYRDTWGVPHVYADSAPEGAYALGYAQAEDRLEDIFKAIRTGLGRMSEAYGKDYIDQDYIMRICDNEKVCKAGFKNLSPELHDIVVAFQKGIEAYMAEHPDHVPESKLELEPWMFGVIGRAMILRWPLGTIQDELGRRKKVEQVGEKGDALKSGGGGPPSFSNEWVVSPSRSAEKCAILLCDPHVTWDSIAVFYEARVHAGPLHMCGFFLIGTPIMGYGHNMNVGWANTTGGPDTADVYEMKIKPGLIPQYEYDGQWKTPRIVPIKINVKGEPKPVIRPSVITHLGPMVSPPEGDRAYVGATPYLPSNNLFEQSYRMNLAQSAEELFKVMGMLELMDQNMMFADTAGTIGYVRQGKTPIRPDGYDWTAPVPGNTSATAWLGIHPIEDLVHIFNPPIGYMQNCNISPAVMMKDSPLAPGKYKSYIFNVNSWERNPRGTRSMSVLDADATITKEDAFALATDVTDIIAPLWQNALSQSMAEVEQTGDESVKLAAKSILEWDGQYLPEATQTVLFRAWRESAIGKKELVVLDADSKLNTEDRHLLADLLAKAVAKTKMAYGRWDVPWGDVYRLGRGDRRVGVPGADFGPRSEMHNYTETLFNVSWEEDKKHPGTYLAHKGTEAPILMFFREDGIESYTTYAWGQSGDPASPHFMDQGEELFSKRRMKPTYWKKEDLLQHLKSQHQLKFRLSLEKEGA